MTKSRLSQITNASLIASAILIPCALYLSFVYAPPERIMGDVQRIFYFHVGSALACYQSIAILFVAAALYLANRQEKHARLMFAAAEVGLVFGLVTLFSGMIWGKSAWNIWFRWEPRLVTFLILCLILGSFQLVRKFQTAQANMQAAVLAIVSALTIPLVKFSVDLLPKSAQLHPTVVAQGGLKDPAYYWAFGITVVGMLVLQVVLVSIATRVESIDERRA